MGSGAAGVRFGIAAVLSDTRDGRRKSEKKCVQGVGPVGSCAVSGRCGVACWIVTKDKLCGSGVTEEEINREVKRIYSGKCVCVRGVGFVGSWVAAGRCGVAVVLRCLGGMSNKL